MSPSTGLRSLLRGRLARRLNPSALGEGLRLKASGPASRALLALAGASLLAGCSLSPNIGQQREASLRGASEADYGGPEWKSAAPELAATPTQIVEIRTEIRRSGVSVTGAMCQARSSAVSLEFRTPARISLPLQGEGAPPIAIRCEHPTQGVASAVLRPGRSQPADGLFEEIFGSEKPAPGRYLNAYELQLTPRNFIPSGPPPEASSAAMEIAFPPRKRVFPRPRPERRRTGAR